MIDRTSYRLHFSISIDPCDAGFVFERGIFSLCSAQAVCYREGREIVQSVKFHKRTDFRSLEWLCKQARLDKIRMIILAVRAHGTKQDQDDDFS